MQAHYSAYYSPFYNSYLIPENFPLLICAAHRHAGSARTHIVMLNKRDRGQHESSFLYQTLRLGIFFNFGCPHDCLFLISQLAAISDRLSLLYFSFQAIKLRFLIYTGRKLWFSRLSLALDYPLCDIWYKVLPTHTTFAFFHPPPKNSGFINSARRFQIRCFGRRTTSNQLSCSGVSAQVGVLHPLFSFLYGIFQVW